MESDSVKCSFISNRTRLSLRKQNAIENSNLQGNVNNFKEDFIAEFDELKKIAKVKSFQDKLLDSLKMLLTFPLIVLKYLQLTY